jgi:ABC-2 type transport system permease protein
MNGVTLLDELKRSWAITVKDVKIYYLRPPALMFGILFPVALFFTFTIGRDIPNTRLVPLLAAQTTFWASSSIGPVAIPMERRIRTFERFLSAPLSLLSVLFGKMMAGVLFGLGITTLALTLSVLVIGVPAIHPFVLILGILLSTMAFSAMGILFASIPTGSPGEVIIPLNFVRIPLMFVSGMFIPLEAMPTVGVYAALLSPLTHTLDLLRLGTGGHSFFGVAVNVTILTAWTLLFLVIGQTFHRIIMKRE